MSNLQKFVIFIFLCVIVIIIVVLKFGVYASNSQTYTNADLGFEIKYQSDYDIYLLGQNYQYSPTASNISVSDNGSGPKEYWLALAKPANVDIQNKVLQNSDNASALVPRSITISLLKNSNDNLNDWKTTQESNANIVTLLGNEDCDSKQTGLIGFKDTVFASLPAIQMTDQCLHYTETEVFHGDDLFRIYVDDTVTASENTALQSIISTFKFTN